LVHATDATPTTLDGIRDRIYAVTDQWALEVGRLLAEAKKICPKRGWTAWCESEIPFGHDKADRLIAIYRAYHGLPEEVLAGLPRPWQAQFALKSVPRPQLEAGIASGAVNPQMTIIEARSWAKSADSDEIPMPKLHRTHSEADLVAGRLICLEPADLDPNVAAELLKWLSSGGFCA
jgi:hypothetical protein